MKTLNELSKYLTANTSYRINPTSDPTGVNECYLEIINLNSSNSNFIFEAVGSSNPTVISSLTLNTNYSSAGFVNNNSMQYGTKYVEACLQPFTISCSNATKTSPTITLDSNTTYLVSINGVEVSLKGSQIQSYFENQNINVIINPSN